MVGKMFESPVNGNIIFMLAKILLRPLDASETADCACDTLDLVDEPELAACGAEGNDGREGSEIFRPLPNSLNIFAVSGGA